MIAAVNGRRHRHGISSQEMYEARREEQARRVRAASERYDAEFAELQAKRHEVTVAAVVFLFIIGVMALGLL